MMDAMVTLLPLLTILALVVLVLWAAHWWLLGRHRELPSDSRLPRQLTLALLGLVATFVVLLALPISDTLRGQILSLLGVVLTGVIGLSSTTFVSNAMAGVMLRIVGQFAPGDFVRIGEQFGRVTERGLLHLEIQTEDRDLTTLPNMFLITNPVTVIHRSGTIVSATVSLGYDVHRHRIEQALKAAAQEAGLDEPFVQVLELGDFSVVYRVAGFLEEVKQLLTARSNLLKAVMDALHAADIEIVSPSFMNQRPQPEGRRMIPSPERDDSDGDDQAPEARIFDKADKAEQIERLKQQLLARSEELAELEKAVKANKGDAGESGDATRQQALSEEVEQLKAQIEQLEAELEPDEPPAADADEPKG